MLVCIVKIVFIKNKGEKFMAASSQEVFDPSDLPLGAIRGVHVI
jgi:hypothetical protein